MCDLNSNKIPIGRAVRFPTIADPAPPFVRDRTGTVLRKHPFSSRGHTGWYDIQVTDRARTDIQSRWYCHVLPATPDSHSAW